MREDQVLCAKADVFAVVRAVGASLAFFGVLRRCSFATLSFLFDRDTLPVGDEEDESYVATGSIWLTINERVSENMTVPWKLAITTAVAIVGLGSVAFFFVGSEGKKGFTSTCGLHTSEIGRFVAVPGGGFIKGADGVYPEEGTPAKLHVSPFQIQVHEVTNDQFAAFVRATGYVTEAENGHGSAQFTETQTPADLYSWWRLDHDATWKTPDGDGSTLQGLGRHPVVHVSLNDARAYADWAGGRIPNEIEWEYAASLGLFDPDDPESGIQAPDGTPRANIWTGVFPVINSEEDGFAGTAPVGCYKASLIGAYVKSTFLLQRTKPVRLFVSICFQPPFINISQSPPDTVRVHRAVSVIRCRRWRDA